MERDFRPTEHSGVDVDSSGATAPDLRRFTTSRKSSWATAERELGRRTAHGSAAAAEITINRGRASVVASMSTDAWVRPTSPASERPSCWRCMHRILACGIGRPPEGIPRSGQAWARTTGDSNLSSPSYSTAPSPWREEGGVVVMARGPYAAGEHSRWSHSPHDPLPASLEAAGVKPEQWRAFVADAEATDAHFSAVLDALAAAPGLAALASLAALVGLAASGNPLAGVALAAAGLALSGCLYAAAVQDLAWASCLGLKRNLSKVLGEWAVELQPAQLRLQTFPAGRRETRTVWYFTITPPAVVPKPGDRVSVAVGRYGRGGGGGAGRGKNKRFFWGKLWG